MQFKSLHKSFIETPITMEIERAIVATSTISIGIENYSLKEYLKQSLFLNLTGSQEQKIRCICWDIASVDYKFRYRWLKGEYALKEYSDIESKSKIYKQLGQFISDLSIEPVAIPDILNKEEIVNDSKNDVINLFDRSIYRYWDEASYNVFERDRKSFKIEHFANEGLLSNPLDEIYDVLYHQRNSYAHNTTSFQQNAPMLCFLSKQDDINHNFFEWIALLNLIDKVFISLYDKYIKVVEHNMF